MAARFLAIVTYDISDDRIRLRVSKMLEKQMQRVQGSVFEGWMTRHAAERLARHAAQLIDREDSLRLYVMRQADIERCAAWGFPPAPEAEDFLML